MIIKRSNCLASFSLRGSGVRLWKSPLTCGKKKSRIGPTSTKRGIPLRKGSQFLGTVVESGQLHKIVTGHYLSY
jgi:hypothetical protein